MNAVKTAVSKLLYLTDDSFIDVLLAAHVANQSETDEMVWVMVVGPPSNGKTEILESIAALPNTKVIGEVTVNTFISGQIVEGKAAATVKGVGLIDQLNGKTALIYDFSEILSIRNEFRGKIFSQLRNIYDGHLSRSFGTHDSKHKSREYEWKGRLGLLAAATPDIDRYTAFESSLGERFLYYRMPDVDKETRLLMSEAARKTRKRAKVLKQEINETMRVAYDKAKECWSSVTISEAADRTLDHIAECVATMRTPVSRDKGRIVNHCPAIEGPGRIEKQLSSLLAGICAVHGVAEPGPSEMSIIAKTALSCVDPIRARVVLSLLSLGKANPSDLARHVKLPRTTVMRTLEDLAVLEILDSNNSIFDADRDDKFMVNSERMEILKLINELAEDKSSPLSLPSVSEEDTVTRKIHIESERGIKSPCTPITGVLSGSFSSEQTIEVKSTEIKDKQPIRVNYGATELEEVKRDSDSTLHRPPLHFAMRPMRMYHGQYGLATHEQDKINLSR